MPLNMTATEKARWLQGGLAPQFDPMLNDIYRARAAVVPTYQIDSGGLALDAAYDLTHRQMTTPSPGMDPATAYAAATALPAGTLILPRATTKAAALAAIDAIRVVVAASALP